MKRIFCFSQIFWVLLLTANLAAQGTGSFERKLEFKLTTTASIPINYDQCINETIAIAGEEDGFTFNGVAGQRVTVFLDHRASIFSSFSLRLTKPDGSSLAYCDFNNGDCEIDNVTLPTTGVYTLTVDGSGASTGDYTLCLNLIPGAMEAIVYDQCLDRDISPMGDQDRFTFNGTAGQRMTVFLDHRASIFSSFSLRLTKPDGSSLAYCDFNNSDCEIDTVTLPITGAYNLTVDGSGASTGNYTLCLNQIPGAVEAISYDQCLDRDISPMGDQDRFTFNGSAGQRVTVFLDHRASIFSSFSLRLTKPDGSSWFCNFNNGDCEIDTVSLPATGPYTVTIDGSGASTGAYTLCLNLLPGQIEPIGYGQSLTRTISPMGDQDSFTFCGAEGKRITAFLDHQASIFSSFSLRLLKPDGSSLAFCDFNNGDCEIGNVILPTTGTYTLTVDGSGAGTGNYALSLSCHTSPCECPVCTYSISPTSQSFGVCGGNGTINVMATPNNCAWTAVSNASWITITSGNSGTGNGMVSYVVAANTANNFRSGTITVAGQTFTVTQSACTFSISPTDQPFGPNGGAGSVRVATSSCCSWTAVSNAAWITITPPGSGTGNGTVNYTVAANLTNSSRSGTMTIAGQTFMVTQSRATSGRRVLVTDTTAVPGGTVSAIIKLVAQGDENALGFSLTFDASILSNPQARLGKDASGATLNTNSSQASLGRYGIALALAAGQKFAGGIREIVVVTFAVNASTVANSTSIGFSDQPIGREIVDTNANSLTTTWTSGTVTITSGFEADVAPRPNGDGKVTIADWVQVGRFVAGLDQVRTDVNEFQRADCASRPCGDGRLTIADWVQAGRYAAGLDALTPACGPTSPGSSTALAANAMNADLKTKSQSTSARAVRAVNTTFYRGQVDSFAVELDAQADENALGFSLNFDPILLTYREVKPGSGAIDATLNVNDSQAANGHLGIALALPTGRKFAVGAQQLVRVIFFISRNTPATTTSITFGDQPIAREIVDASANALSTTWMAGTITIQIPAAVNQAANGVPISFALEQNHPNPFNPSTTIAFSLPRTSHVTLKVFDLLGKEIVTLVDKQLGTGRYEVRWNANGFESGTYFYQLRAEEFMATKKLILMQ